MIYEDAAAQIDNLLSEWERLTFLDRPQDAGARRTLRARIETEARYLIHRLEGVTGHMDMLSRPEVPRCGADIHDFEHNSISFCSLPEGHEGKHDNLFSKVETPTHLT